MGQGTDADSLDTGFGDLSNDVERDSAGRFQLGGRLEMIANLNRFLHSCWTHVVEENNVRLCSENILELVKCIYLDLDKRYLIVRKNRGIARGRFFAYQLLKVRFGPADRFSRRKQVASVFNTGTTFFRGMNIFGMIAIQNVAGQGPKSKVIVLNQHRIIKPGSVISSSAASDRVFFQPPPAERRFTGVVNFCSGPFDLLDEPPRQCRDTAKVSEKIQKESFRRHHRQDRSDKFPDFRPFFDKFPFLTTRKPPQFGINQRDTGGNSNQTGDNTFFSDMERGTPFHTTWNEGLTGQIAQLTEIFGDCDLHEAFQIILMGLIPVILVEISFHDNSLEGT